MRSKYRSMCTHVKNDKNQHQNRNHKNGNDGACINGLFYVRTIATGIARKTLTLTYATSMEKQSIP